MAFDQTTRNRLQKLVSDCRKALSDEFRIQVQQIYGLDPSSGDVTPLDRLSDLSDRERQTAQILRDTLDHYLAGDTKDNSHTVAVIDRIIREQAFTVLNRLAAILMMEARGIVRPSVSHAEQSQAFELYKYVAGSALGETGDAYRTFLFSVFDEFAQDLPSLFDRFAPQGRLFPRAPALLQVLELLNHHDTQLFWGEDETIGWIYQYFNSKEERKAMRDASQAPRNSRELAVRNQFFTPRYVVEFLVENTLGRLWFNATGGQTVLRDRCQYLLIKANEQPEAAKRLRDPRTLKLLDPACGSMHFGLYAFDLFAQIYREAWDWEQQHGPGSLDITTQPEAAFKPLCHSYKNINAYLCDVPRLIIEHNIYGVDIDPRAAQIASLALWLRAQRAWHEAGVKATDRPLIGLGNVVAAIAPPAERELHQRFVAELNQLDAELFEKTLQLLKWLPEMGVLLQLERDVPQLIGKVYGRVGDMFKEKQAKSWDQIEQGLRKSLIDFYGAASSTYQGRLFVQDALQGLRIIDLASEQYDVLVMNPPFGLPAANAKEIIKKTYPDTWSDYYNAFIKRATELLSRDGLFGAVVPNRLLYTKKSSAIRDLLSSTWSLTALVDAGRDVMDDAAVDALFFAAGRTRDDQKICCPVLNLKDTDISARPAALLAWSKEPESPIDFSYFKSIPGNSFAYSAPIDYLKLWQSGRKLDPSFATVATGGKTFDDVRFLRLRWEVLTDKLADKWLSVDTGGDYQVWYAPSVFVQNWGNDGAEIRAFAISKHATDAQVMQSSKHWFKAGISYPYTSSIGFGPRVLPKGTIFSSDSIAIHPTNNGDALALLSLLASDWTSELLNCFGEGRKTENSLVKSLPISINDSYRDVLEVAALGAINSVIEIEAKKETSPLFWSPFSGRSLDELEFLLRRTIVDIDLAAKAAYGISIEKESTADNQRLVSNYAEVETEATAASSELSYLVGVAFGRWDICCATGVLAFSPPINVFKELPQLPPGMLGGEGQSNAILGIDGEEFCLVEKIRNALQTLYGENGESRENWLCSSLGVGSIADYLNSTGGFFWDHLKCYSRSGRKAPIYWPLTTTSGNYTLWVYYPSLTSQTLYIAINDFVEPKLKHVRGDIVAMRNKGGERSRDDEKQFETLQAFELELIELRDILLKVAQSYYPNHDDGVQITAAPLWQLFRHKPWQKILKDTWAKLEKGDYDWAHLAMNYWPDRVREKCKTDKSLAIAHGLEDLYVEPESKPKKAKGRKKAGSEE